MDPAPTWPVSIQILARNRLPDTCTLALPYAELWVPLPKGPTVPGPTLRMTSLWPPPIRCYRALARPAPHGARAPKPPQNGSRTQLVSRPPDAELWAPLPKGSIAPVQSPSGGQHNLWMHGRVKSKSVIRECRGHATPPHKSSG